MDLRDAFFGKIYEIVKNNKNAILLTADHGAFWVSEIEKNFPSQYINVGIAEQNMLSVAAGLAISGKKVFVYGINNFIIMRSFEQLNIDICGMNLDVNLIGVGSGFTYSTDGPTHHGIQDLAAVMNLPNISVYNVTDSVNSIEIANLASQQTGPKYFRIEKGIVNTLYNKEDNFFDGLKKIKNTNNPKITLVSSGFMSQICYEVANELQNLNINCDVIDIFRVKPINENLFLNLLSSDKLICVEDNLKSGGIGEKIATILFKNKKFIDYNSIAVDDQFCFYYGSRDQLNEKYEIDKKTIINKIIKMVSNGT